MKTSGILSSGGASLNRAQVRLVELVAEIQHKHQARNEPMLANPQGFAIRLFELARDYELRLSKTKRADLARQRYSAVHKAAQSLLIAMADLEGSEREALWSGQQEAFRAACSADAYGEMDRSREYEYEAAGSVYGPRKPWLAIEDLRWLLEAAGQLAKGRPRGGQTKLDEQWVAKEFVVICHQFGWCPIRFADTPNIGKCKMPSTKACEAPSLRLDAVGCLAAVLAIAGVSVGHAERMALSALRTMRKQPFVHVQRQRLAWDGEGRGWDTEVVYYTYSLTGIIARDNGIGELPQFMPGRRR